MLALTIVPFANSTWADPAWIDLCRLSHMALGFPAPWLVIGKFDKRLSEEGEGARLMHRSSW